MFYVDWGARELQQNDIYVWNGARKTAVKAICYAININKSNCGIFVLIEVNCKTNHMLSDIQNIFNCILMMTIRIASDMSNDGCKCCTRDFHKEVKWIFFTQLWKLPTCMSIHLSIFKNSLRFSLISTSLRCCFSNDSKSYDRTDIVAADFASLTLFMNNKSPKDSSRPDTLLLINYIETSPADP